MQIPNSNSSSSDDDRRVKPAWAKDKVLNFKLNELDKNEKKKKVENAISIKEELVFIFVFI